jgi:hypothetical protein
VPLNSYAVRRHSERLMRSNTDLPAEIELS